MCRLSIPTETITEYQRAQIIFYLLLVLVNWTLKRLPTERIPTIKSTNVLQSQITY